jgi:hypothetical protein
MARDCDQAAPAATTTTAGQGAPPGDGLVSVEDLFETAI